MSKYKIAGLTAITTMFFIAGSAVSADNVTLQFEGPILTKFQNHVRLRLKLLKQLLKDQLIELQILGLPKKRFLQ